MIRCSFVRLFMMFLIDLICLSLPTPWICLDLLIINFFYSPFKFGFCANEICSSIAVDFSDRSSLTNESSQCLNDRIGFKEICLLYE